jgi:hypothetical protein
MIKHFQQRDTLILSRKPALAGRAVCNNMLPLEKTSTSKTPLFVRQAAFCAHKTGSDKGSQKAGFYFLMHSNRHSGRDACYYSIIRTVTANFSELDRHE